MSTVDQTIDSALRMAGLIGPGHTFSSATSGLRVAAIDILNTMLQSWGVDGINVPAEIAQAAFVVTASDGTYTIGSGGDISIARPAKISRASWKAVGSTFELPMYELSDDEYQGWPDKTTEGLPVAWHYKNASPLGTIYLLRIPDEAGSLTLYTPVLFTVYTAGANTIALTDGYDQAIRATLALLFLAEFSSLGAKMDPVVLDGVQRTARDAKANLRRLNYRRPQASSDFPAQDLPLSQEEFESGAWLHW